MMLWQRSPVALRRLLTGTALAAMVVTTTVLPAAAQTPSTDLKTITVAGTGVATAPAETARIQIVVGANMMYGMGVSEPAMITTGVNVPGETQAAQAIPASPATDSGTSIVAATSAATSAEAIGDTVMVSIADPLTGEVVITPEDLQPVVDALVAEGIDASAIKVVTGPAVTGWFGAGSSSSGLIELTLEKPSLVEVTALLDAANKAATGDLAVQQVGVEYGLSDCSALVDASRAAAFDDARTRAESLGSHIGATVEAPVQVQDYNATILPVSATNDCPPLPDMAYLSATSQAFNTPSFNANAPAEARVMTQLTVTYEYELAAQ